MVSRKVLSRKHLGGSSEGFRASQGTWTRSAGPCHSTGWHGVARASDPAEAMASPARAAAMPWGSLGDAAVECAREEFSVRYVIRRDAVAAALLTGLMLAAICL